MKPSFGRPMQFYASMTAVAAILLLSGCGTFISHERITADGNSQAQAANAQLDEIAKGIQSAGRNAGQVDPDEVQRPFLAGTPVPLAAEVTLPPALRQNVTTTLLFREGQRNLQGLAEAITRATGIPVKVRPDALLPMSNFLPRAGGADGKSASSSAAVGGLDTTVLDIRAEEVALNSLLDRVGSRLALNWKFDGRAIVFYRLETRGFQLKALPIKTSMNAGLGRNGQQKDAFDNSNTTKYAADAVDPFVSVRAAIEARMTRAGLGPVIAPETGSVTVTDTPEVLDSIEQYIARENRLLSRRVDLVFEAITVRMKDNGSLGVDWSAVLQRLADETMKLSISPVASLVNSGAGAINYQVSGGRFDGSKIALQALSEFGTVVNVTRVPAQTTNRVPASYAMRSTFNYIDQATSGQQAASAVNTTTSGPTITQKDETVGTILTVVPDADEDGIIRMSISYDKTELVKLDPFTTGSGLATVTVQQKEIDGAGVLQQVVARSGVPTIVGGFENRSMQATSRRMDKNLPLVAGGSDRTVQERLITVLVVTAVGRDGQ